MLLPEAKANALGLNIALLTRQLYNPARVPSSICASVSPSEIGITLLTSEHCCEDQMT